MDEDYEKLLPYNISNSFGDFSNFQRYEKLDMNLSDAKFFFGGRVKFNSWDEITVIKNLKGSLEFHASTIKTLGSLETVEKDLTVSRCLNDLGNLRKVGGNMFIDLYKGKSLNKLEYVEKNVDIRHCRILETLGDLKHVGKSLEIYNTPKLKSLGKLKTVGRHLDLKDCDTLEDLGDLEEVGGTIEYDYDNHSLIRLLEDRDLI